MDISELKYNLNQFFQSYAFYIALGVAVLIAVAIILIVIFSKRKKGNKIEKQNVIINTNDWLEALGGRENILEKNATGSRLVVKLQEPEKMNEERLKELGVSNILKMSNKITLVFEDQAEKILSQLE